MQTGRPRVVLRERCFPPLLHRLRGNVSELGMSCKELLGPELLVCCKKGRAFVPASPTHITRGPEKADTEREKKKINMNKKRIN